MKLPVLMYHHIGHMGPGAHPNLTVAPRDFERQMAWLATHAYSPIRSSDWLAWLREGRPLPPKPILLTFDDGYADTFEHALPVLRRYGFPALLFVVTGVIGKTNEWDEKVGWGTYHLVSEEQILQWSSAGMEIGGHTRTHRNLTKLSAEELEDEINGSKADLERILGFLPTSFAYPYGRLDQRARDCAGRFYELSFTVEEGLNSAQTDCRLMRRVMVWPHEKALSFACLARLGLHPVDEVRRRIRPRTRLRIARDRMRSIILNAKSDRAR